MINLHLTVILQAGPLENGSGVKRQSNYGAFFALFGIDELVHPSRRYDWSIFHH
jgi:ribosomal protein S1